MGRACRRRKQDLIVGGAPLTFDGRLHPLELQEYPDGLVVGNLGDLRRMETRERSARCGESRSRPVDSSGLLTSKMTHLTTLPYFSHSSFVSPSRSSSTSPRPTMFCKTHTRDIGDTEETAGRYERARCLTKNLFRIPATKKREITIKKSSKVEFFLERRLYNPLLRDLFFIFLVFGEYLVKVWVRADSYRELRQTAEELHKVSIKNKITRQHAPYPILELAIRHYLKTSLEDFNCWWKDWTCTC